MDIDVYLERIGAEMPEAPSLAALSTLHQKHSYAVPFENLDAYRGIPVVLDEARILDKIVRQRRGGACIETNTAFAWLLRKLGYRVTMLSGDVAISATSFGAPGQHLLLLVDLGPEVPLYIADVGYGDGSVYPMPLVPEVETEDRYARYRMIVSGEYWLVQRAPERSGVFEPLFRFTTVPRSLPDFEPHVVWGQTSPDSPWRKINCSRPTPEGRVQLFGNRLVVTAGGTKTGTWIKGETALNQTLRRHFGLALPPIPG